MEQMHDLLTTRNRLMRTYHAIRKPQDELRLFDETSYKTIALVQEGCIEWSNKVA